jgi:hypothetical protein
MPIGNAVRAVSTATAHDDSIVRSHASSVRCRCKPSVMSSPR